jgi:nicotinate-nucleotide adenylyltransferase
MRIGVLGGTFDPPHIGHLQLAKAAIEQLELDEVLFIPANRNPMKSQKSETSAKHRMAMVERLVADEEGMAFTDMEITRGGPSYSVDTLNELHMVTPADYWFIMGADALKTFSSWKSPHRLLKLCRLAVALRPPLTVADVMLKLPEETRSKVDVISMPGIEIASSDLRNRMLQGKPVTQWLTPKVLQYIHTHKLYQSA